MSYELSITRAGDWPEAAHWSEGGHGAIAFREWEALVEADSELAIDYSNRLADDEYGRMVDGRPELAECRVGDGFRFSEEQDRLLRDLARDLKRAAPDPAGLEHDAAEWLAHPGGEERHFWFERGIISVPDPDVATLDKMFRIAETLGALVRGDDGELYRRRGHQLECYEPGRGWLPFEEFHRGRPDWAPILIREIAQGRPETRSATQTP